MLHLEDRLAEAEIGGFGAADTRFPFILFVSQAETERILTSQLEARGARIERGVEVVDFEADDRVVACTLRHADGRQEAVDAAYVVGCDGAHSTVRKGAGIPFEGAPYVQDFMLGDVEADGPIERDTLHSFAGAGGIAMFFPLGSPSTWRVIAMASDSAREPATEPGTSSLPLAELQAVVDGATGSRVQLRDPVWLTHFRLHHRQAGHYRAGRVFLAGDAGHIHSPVGAQGMNTGIQDAWNLGWKLAFTIRGWADDRLLDTYESERWPIGRSLLRTTDRVFEMFVGAMSAGRLAAWVRREVVARVLPRVLRSRRLRDYAFGFISELRIHYRSSPAVREGKPSLGSGVKAGSRLPDAAVTRHGEPAFLQEELAGPGLHLLLCGDSAGWDRDRLDALASRYGAFFTCFTLGRTADEGDDLVDESGDAFRRLGVDDFAQYLVRPDGYIAFRCGGQDLRAVAEYLDEWFRPG
jgi:2-polyprenyl-6-methoxyphenol hydroxylase-like FAD-dependent oxidoreductase